MSIPASKAARAADWLAQAHERRERFVALPEEFSPKTVDEAYAIQQLFAAQRAKQRGAAVGYKIALSSAAMRRFVGVDSPQAGVIHESTVHHSPARIRAADYVNLIVEFEIAVELAADLPAADAPFSRERVARAVGAVIPAIEIADDRGADYTTLARYPLDLIADNTWNEGVVLGAPIPNWKGISLEKTRAIAHINGVNVGEGIGAEAMGHPFDAVAWIADHLASRRHGLLRKDFVITGSLVTSKRVKAGDHVRFELENLGGVELRVE
jgi:2-keto-4-pentenoate hydratase